jgi:2-succinyl-5-enolpyruvyl-6-hydroxy-3-cyclohexene-1-carboxylate synthase
VDATNRNTALASAFVEELARCGLRRAVISPGSRSSPIALALWRAPAIEATVVVDERSAAFFALGAAQASGLPVAIVTTSGTAAAELHPAVCEADESSVPLLALTSDRPPELRGIGAGQTIDQLKLYGSAVRWFCEVGTHEADDDGLLHLRSTACRAFAAARGEPRPGPVHLNLSWRDPLGPEPAADVTATSALALEGREGRPLTAVTTPGVEPDEFVLGELARHLTEAERPLIVAGRSASARLAEPVAALAAAAEAPVLAEPTSQLRLGGHDRSRVVAAYDFIARARPAALEPDLVLRFGEMPTSKALRLWLRDLRGTPQLVVDPGHGWNEPTRHAAAMVRSDPAAVAAGLAERVGAGDESWPRRWGNADRRASEAIAAGLEGERPSEPGAHRALGGLYSDGEIVYTASSMPIRDQEAFLPSAGAGVRFLANRGANGIDGLVSSGLGAAVESGRPAWVLTGDLGLHHDSNALALAGRASAPVRIVVFNNDGGGIFEHLPQAGQVEREEFEALWGTPVGLDVAGLAATWGLPHRRVEDLGDLAEATLETGIAEVPVDRLAGVEARRRLADAAVAAVEGAAHRGEAGSE